MPSLQLIHYHESFTVKKSSRTFVAKGKQPIYTRETGRVDIFFREKNDVRIIISGESCHLSGIYKTLCVHALECSFSKGQKLPRCERGENDVRWVLRL
jgi:hypothetical protein